MHYDDEISYLKAVRNTRPRRCDNRIPLYKEKKVSFSGKGESQHGGFLPALAMILRYASPFIVDYAIKRFSGDGFEYRHSDKSELTEKEKKLLLLSILDQNPHIQHKIFS